MKVALDTNILLRLFLGDHPAQQKAALAVVKEAELVAIPIHAICEFVWVLTRGYKRSRAEAGAEGARSAPWESFGAKDSGRVSDLPKAGAKLAQAAAQVGRGGTPEQVRQAVDVLDEARRKLYSILAQD